jgi:hypothetical protein
MVQGIKSRILYLSRAYVDERRECTHATGQSKSEDKVSWKHGNTRLEPIVTAMKGAPRLYPKKMKMVSKA